MEWMKAKLGSKKRLALAFALVALVGSASYWMWGGGASAAEYMTAKAERGNLRNSVTATGALQAVTTVQVGSQASGTISALYADFNSTVKKGQVIAQLDPSTVQAQVQQARANLQQAQAALQQSRAGLVQSRAGVSQSRAGVTDAQAKAAAAGSTVENQQAGRRQRRGQRRRPQGAARRRREHPPSGAVAPSERRHLAARVHDGADELQDRARRATTRPRRSSTRRV